MYVRLDKIKATAHLESIVSNEDLVNGQFVALGKLQADGEARLVTPSGDVNEDLVLHVSTGLTYDDRTTELDFVLEAGKEGRGYVLESGNIVSISVDGVIGEHAENSIVVPDGKGFAVADITSGMPTGIAGKIIGYDIDVNAGRLAVIRIR